MIIEFSNCCPDPSNIDLMLAILLADYFQRILKLDIPASSAIVLPQGVRSAFIGVNRRKLKTQDAQCALAKVFQTSAFYPKVHILKVCVICFYQKEMKKTLCAQMFAKP